MLRAGIHSLRRTPIALTLSTRRAIFANINGAPLAMDLEMERQSSFISVVATSAIDR